MKKSRFLSALLALVLLLSPICALPALAGPAYPGPVTIEEPGTGKCVTVLNHGDEYFNYTTDTQGYLFVQKGGRFYYVCESNGSYTLGVPVTSVSINGGAADGYAFDTRVRAPRV